MNRTRLRLAISMCIIAASVILSVLSFSSLFRLVSGDLEGIRAYDDLKSASQPLRDAADSAAGARSQNSTDAYIGADMSADRAEDPFDPEVLQAAFADLVSLCPDCVGWIILPGTAIDYPIVQPTQERGQEYWLDHLFTGEENRMGSIFIDKRCGRIGECGNTVIYGHNLKNGTMFRALTEYLGSEDFIAEHPCFYIAAPDGVYECTVFCVAEVDTSSALYTVCFTGSRDREAFVRLAVAENRADTSFIPDPENPFATLSTCSYGFRGARLLVVAEMRQLKKINLF